MRVRRRRPHLTALAVPLVLAGALVPATGASAAAKPKLTVSAKAAGNGVTVKVRSSASGRIAIAVRASGTSTIAKGRATLKRGATRTLTLKTKTCRACRKVQVVGTLTPQSGRPVTSTTTVTLPAASTTTTATTTTTTAARAAPATTTAPTTTTTAARPTSTTTTTTTTSRPAASTAQAPAVSPDAGTTVAGSAASTGTTAPTTTAKLAWAPPALSNPVTVSVTASNRNLRLDNAKDYVISMPAGGLSGGYGLVINGGHNVVLIGGEIDIPYQGDPPPVNSRRGLYLLNQTGTVHVEGLWIHGSDLSEGIDLDERLGATVQIENVRIDSVHARDEAGFTDNHPDLIQTWGGPDVLRVDHLTGSSDYQGFFFAPMQYGSVAPTLFDLRNIDISAVTRNNVFFAGYLLWQSSAFPMNIRNLYVVPDARKGLAGSQYPRTGVWTAAAAGTPAAGSFATTAQVGAAYRSAGYAAS